MAYPDHHSDSIRHIGDGPPAPQRLVCPSIGCAADGWYIEREPGSLNAWLIATEAGGAGWVIAADEPICPYCAATLSERHEPALDIGPFGRFVRNLAA